jgi:asparagine synthase (glutamine-hydrolysing)
LSHEIVDRPKAGFTPPVAKWLRHHLLRDWVESLLDPVALQDVPFLDPVLVRGRWRQHLAGSYEWHGFLWPLLMLLDWRRNLGRPAA